MEPSSNTPSTPTGGVSPKLIIGGAIAALVVVLAVVVITQMSGDDTPHDQASLVATPGVEEDPAGGDPSIDADTPEAAVEALVAAVTSSDVEAALATLVPSEREVLDHTVRDLLYELGRIDLLTSDIDLRAIPGVEIEVTGLSLSAAPTSDDVTLVNISGTVQATFLGADLPLGRAVTESGVVPSPASIGSPPPEALDLTVATVRVDGRWFVSIGHTLVENQRRAANWPAPDAGQAVTAVSHESPEAAAEALAATLRPFDLAAFFATLNPGEADAFQRHASNYLTNMAGWATEADTPTISDLEYRIDTDGDRATVIIDTVTVSWTGQPGYGPLRTSLRLEDGCVNVKEEYPEPDQPGGEGDDGWADEEEDWIIPGFTQEDDGSVTMCPTSDQPFSLGFVGWFGMGGVVSPPDIGLVRHEGLWYVSPTLTLANDLLRSLREIPDGQGARLIGPFTY